MLSLDAPVVAVLWQDLIARQLSVSLGLAARLALGLTVWAIYLLDRLLDSKGLNIAQESARHEFHRLHRKAIAALLAVLLLADAIVLAWLPGAVLDAGAIALLGAALYLLLIHAGGRWSRLPWSAKPTLVAVLFTIGTFLAAATTGPHLDLPECSEFAVTFLLLCFLNLITIELWDEDRGEARQAETHTVATMKRFYPALALLLVMPLALHPTSGFYQAVAASDVAITALYFFGTGINADLRHAAIDFALFTPLLLRLS